MNQITEDALFRIRKNLMEQYKIDCLDHLVYSMQKEDRNRKGEL